MLYSARFLLDLGHLASGLRILLDLGRLAHRADFSLGLNISWTPAGT